MRIGTYVDGWLNLDRAFLGNTELQSAESISSARLVSILEELLFQKRVGWTNFTFITVPFVHSGGACPLRGCVCDGIVVDLGSIDPTVVASLLKVFIGNTTVVLSDVNLVNGLGGLDVHVVVELVHVGCESETETCQFS